jgi:parvulin-like peptidyl-prolyl isomerase
VQPFDPANVSYSLTPVAEQQVANQSGNDATTAAEMRTKTAMLMDRLQKGAAFGDLAIEFSEDAESAARGGDLGLVPISAVRQASPALRDAVLALTPGNARVVNQGGAQAIVLLVGVEKAGQRDLSTPGTKDQISAALKARKEALLRAAYITKLRDDADVTNHLARRLVESGGKL